MNDAALTTEFNRWQTRALLVGAIATVISLVGAFLQPTAFFRSYLFAWLFWCGLSFGALVIVMMQFLTGGQWGLAIRGLSTAAFRTLPLMAVLFVPVLLGIHQIYSWSNGDHGDTGNYHHKAQYLTVPFFAARGIFYFVVLIAIGVLLYRWMTPPLRNNALPTRITALSASGLITYVLCMNFASTDWAMSLDPKFYSTVFVEIFAAGQFLSALALMTALLATFSRRAQFANAIPTKAFQDLGSMLLAFVIFWTYVSFSQLLIIWSGNLPKEISWYLDRSRGGWQWLALALVVVQFFIPFALLLSRAAKRDRERLGAIAWWIVGANMVATFWLVAPSFYSSGIHVHWLDFTLLLALGGFWFALFFYLLKQRPLVPAELLEATQNG